MKMIMAVLNGEDESETIKELNKKGFFVTELTATGGFLRQKRATLLIGVEDFQTEQVMGILQKYASKRKTVSLAAIHMESSGLCPGANCAIPVNTETGGCTAFILDMMNMEKF